MGPVVEIEIMSLEKRALKGAFSLSLLKAIDYIVPLVLIPYIIHILGLEFYGEYTYFQVIAIFLAFAADYSLPTVGVQVISQKKRRYYINDLISSFVTFKIFNIIFLLILFFLLVKFLKIQFDLFVISGICIFLGLSLQNTWLYQAYEIYKPLIIFSGISRLICLIITPVFVHNVNDKNVFLLIQSLMYLVPGLFCILYSFYKFKIKFLKFEKRYIIYIIRNGFYVFQYRVINASIIPINNQVILIYADAKILAIYNLIMKGLSALVNFLTPISLSVQPILAELKNEKKDSFYKFFIKIRNKLLLASAFFSSTLFFVMVFYLNFYMSLESEISLYLLIFLLSITLVPHALNGLYSQTLNLFEHSKYVRNVIAVSSIISLALLPFFVYEFQAIGIGIINFIMYFTILTFMYMRIKNEFE